MQYWRGGKQRAKEAPQSPSPFELATGFLWLTFKSLVIDLLSSMSLIVLI